jgi:hypothetical protein
VLAVVGVVLLAVVAVAAVLVVQRVRTTPQERYCDELVSRRAELTATLSRDGDGLIVALPILEDLRERAPDDLADEWQQLVTAVQGLSDAVDAAGVDPATYDRDDPPAGVSQAQRTRIDEAATVLGSASTRSALLSIDQQARDVCGTPLTQ